MSTKTDEHHNSRADENVCLTPPRGTERTGASWATPQSPGLAQDNGHTTPRPLGSNASAASTGLEEHENNVHNSPGIQDKLGQMAASTGSNALLGMMELLKLAGGATLSTTGKIVAPPLHVTRTILLPSLWAAAKDYIRDKTPKRVKDWFRIVSSSVYHIHSVLISTDQGKDLRSKVGTVGIDIVDCASSEASRQAFVDGMACLVKLSEALHTPETKALLEQMSVLGCRLVDAASTGRTKQLLHDTSECAWAAVELFADPAATLAFAEVTAYFCHALEMENELHRPISKTSLDANTRAQMRRDRNRYERSTYVDPHLIGDPDATVEQAILSSLGRSGGGGGSLRELVSGGRGGVDTNSLPSNVMWNERVETSAMGSESQSVKGPTDDEENDAAHELEQHWKEHANNMVDVALLQERIGNRAKRLSQHGTGRMSTVSSTTDPPLRDDASDGRQQNGDNDSVEIEDLKQPILDSDDGGDDAHDVTPMQSNVDHIREPFVETKRRHVTLEQEDGHDELLSKSDDVGSFAFNMEREYMIPVRDPLEPMPSLADNAPSTDLFYRALDELLVKKRNETVEALLAGESMSRGSVDKETGVSERLSQPAHKQERSAKIRAAVRSLAAKGDMDVKSKLNPSQRPTDRAPTPLEEALDRYTVLLGLFLGCLAIAAVFWFGFGCYGMYVYFFSANQSGTLISTTLTADPEQVHATQEIVVRVVREVVHVNSNGDVIQDASPDASIPHALNADEIAACVADSIS